MNSVRPTHRIAIVAAGTALIAMGTLTACSPTTEKDAPSTPSSTVSTSSPSSTVSTSSASTSAATPSPTEKAMLPGGADSFTPTINPVPPGTVCKDIVNGVCMR